MWATHKRKIVIGSVIVVLLLGKYILYWAFLGLAKVVIWLR